MKCVMTALASMTFASQPRQSARQSVILERSLRLYRTEQAFVRAIPAMNVYSDRLMSEIVSARPKTLKQLLAMKGIGAARFENYGRDIVRMINLNSGTRAGKRKPRAHTAGPRPKPRPKPKPKPAPRKLSLPKRLTAARALSASAEPAARGPTSVYILELEGGYVYVGSSTNVQRRIGQHKAGWGSAFTRANRPTGVLLPRLGNVQGDGDAAERDETLRYMFLRGIPMVRGWKFTQVIMPFSDFAEAEANIRELYDLCRRCGRPGHFITQCSTASDRWGRACGGKSQ